MSTEAPITEPAAWLEAIRRRLFDRRLSHAAADKLCGWELGTTNKILNGQRAPLLRTLLRLSEAAGLTLHVQAMPADSHADMGALAHSGLANGMQHVRHTEADHVQDSPPPQSPL